MAPDSYSNASISNVLTATFLAVEASLHLTLAKMFSSKVFLCVSGQLANNNHSYLTSYFFSATT